MKKGQLIAGVIGVLRLFAFLMRPEDRPRVIGRLSVQDANQFRAQVRRFTFWMMLEDVFDGRIRPMERVLLIDATTNRPVKVWTIKSKSAQLKQGHVFHLHPTDTGSKVTQINAWIGADTLPDGFFAVP